MSDSGLYMIGVVVVVKSEYGDDAFAPHRYKVVVPYVRVTLSASVGHGRGFSHVLCHCLYGVTNQENESSRYL